MPGELEASTRWQINVGDDSQRHDRGGNTMNRRSAISMWLLLAGSAIFCQAHGATGQTGWITLFDGSNLNNFEPIGNAN
jgi:hypothetical protein